MIDANSNRSRMSQKERKLLNASNGTKTGNQTMTNSCISTDKSPSSSEKHHNQTHKKEVNELLNYMINSLESTNSNMKLKLKPSINVSVYDHLNQIRQDVANGKIKYEKPNEEDKEESNDHNPYVYPNSYSLLPTIKRYEILGEIRDRTDERVLKYEQVLEEVYGYLSICDNKAPYVNVINEQKKRMKNTFNKENRDSSIKIVDNRRNGLVEKGDGMSMSNSRITKPFSNADFDEEINVNNSFEKTHSDDMLQKILIDKDRKKKLNQCSISINSNPKTNNDNYNGNPDLPLASTQQNSAMAIHRNQSIGSFIEKDTKSIQFFENKIKQTKNDVNERINMINITNSKSVEKSPINQSKQKIN